MVDQQNNSHAKRLFLGIALPKEETQAIVDFADFHHRLKGIKWIPAQNLHITTYFLGAVEVALLDNLLELLRIGFKKVQPFELIFYEYTFAPRPSNPRMIWAKYQKHPDFKELVYQIDRLYQQIHPNQQNRKSPIPHITIARLKNFYAFNRVSLKRYFPTEPLQVREIVLWESILRPSGAVYQELQRFELTTS